MRKAYSNPENFTDREFDFILGHIGDETVPLFMDADISHLKGQRILGHIHNAVNDNYLGTPYVTRADEAGKSSFIGSINEETKVLGRIPVPDFLRYTKVKYGDKVPELAEGIEQILLVKKAPSTTAAKEFYSDYYVGKVELAALSERSVDGDKTKSTEKSNSEYLQEFCVANNVDEAVKQKLIEVL